MMISPAGPSLALLICPPVWAALPPAGLAYLAESVEKENIPVHIHDLNLQLYNMRDKNIRRNWTINPDYTHPAFYRECHQLFPEFAEELIHSLRDKGTTHLGMSLFSSNSAFSLALSRRLKAELPHCIQIWGGPEIFSLFQRGKTLPEWVDHFVIGQGEKALLDILAGKGQRIHNSLQGPGPASHPPWPRYRSFDLSGYSHTPSLPLISSRGCPNRCRFCTERLLVRHYTWRRPEEVLEEIRFHYHTHDTRHFVFFDSLINGHPSGFEKFLDGLLAQKISISWEAQFAIRPRIHPSLFAKMRSSGCVNLFIGLESGSGSLLRKMGKPFSPAEATELLAGLAAAGLQSEISLIAHYPGETKEEFEETLNFIRQNRGIIKKIAQVSRFRPYPGAEVPLPADYNPGEADTKIACLVECFRETGIPYTKSYIDNLI